MVGPDDGPVVVTGASGYVGSAVVAELLDRGFTVRAAVRDPGRVMGERHLPGLTGAGDRFTAHHGDLTVPGSYDEAMSGASAVVHVASPYVLTVEDPARDLLTPAVEGTRSVLRSATAAGTVRRVVVTSSLAAVTDHPTEEPITEERWNTDSTLDRNPYYLSKAEAERAAWRFVADDRPPFDLVAVLPGAVTGPSIVPALNETNRLIVQLATGRIPAVIDLSFGFVDVRDVAVTHAEALVRPDAHGRYLAVAEVWKVERLADLMADLGYRVPRLRLTSRLGSVLAKGFAAFQPAGERAFVRANVGRTFTFGDLRPGPEFGQVFRPMDTSFRETLADLARWGHLPAP